MQMTLYSSAASLEDALCELQSAFNIIQENLSKLKLVLNAQKIK